MFEKIKKSLFGIPKDTDGVISIEEENFLIIRKLLSEEAEFWIKKNYNTYEHSRTGIKIEVHEYASELEYPVKILFSREFSKEINKLCHQINEYIENKEQYFLNDFLEQRMTYSIHIENFQDDALEIKNWLLDETKGKTFLDSGRRYTWFELEEDRVAFKLVWG